MIYKDFVQGSGTEPLDGQQVVFDYTAYNENGAAIDSSYRKGRPAETRLGISGLIPGDNSTRSQLVYQGDNIVWQCEL